MSHEMVPFVLYAVAALLLGYLAYLNHREQRGSEPATSRREHDVRRIPPQPAAVRRAHNRKSLYRMQRRRRTAALNYPPYKASRVRHFRVAHTT